MKNYNYQLNYVVLYCIKSKDFYNLEKQTFFKKEEFEILESEFNFKDGWLNYYTQYFTYNKMKYAFDYYICNRLDCSDLKIVDEYAYEVEE